jgi:selenocysteine-specific elongation factor
VLWGDRFVIRRPSPSQTIGGGVVVDPNPPRHKRFQPEVLQTLATLATGSPAEVLFTAIAARPMPLPPDPAYDARGLSATQITAALADLQIANRVTTLRVAPESSGQSGYVFTTQQRDLALARALADVGAFHERYPLRRGLPVQTLRGQLDLPPAVADAALASFAADGHLVLEQATVRLPGFSIRFNPEQQALIDSFLTKLAEQPYTPPAPASLGLDTELVAALEHLGLTVRINPEIVLAPAALSDLTATILTMIDTNGTVSLGQVRDRFQTTRRYAQAILEYLDRQRLTRRIGDERVRIAPPGSPTTPNATTAPPATPEGDHR